MEVSEEPKKLNTIIDDKKIIEQFISNNSYGFYQFNAIILSILILSIEAIFLSEISYLVIPLKEKYGENNFKLELCAAIVFIGQAIGSTLISYLLKFATRKTWILICLVFMCILQGILIFITTLFGLTLIRFFLGILLGATFPITINICCEYLPVTYRSFVMNSLYIGFSVGQLFMLIVMYYIMPNLEHKQIKIFMIYLFFYILLVTIIFFILIEDSPRNLILIGKLKQGIQI